MAFVHIVAFLLYFSLGILQFAATLAGLEEWLGLHWLIAAPISLIVSYIPLAGTIVGMFGAVTAWQWSWLQAGALFFGPLMVIIVLSLAFGGIEAISSRRTRN
jgi:hypothetical protein